MKKLTMIKKLKNPASSIEALLAFNITNLRIKRQITLSDLAKKSGVSRANIFNIQASIWSPTISTVEKIAKALNVEVFDLFKPSI